MLRLLILWLAVAVVQQLGAQFDVGATLGVQRSDILGRASEGHTSASFYNVERPQANFGLFYRERHGSHTNLGLELTWMRSEFDASLYEGSLAGGMGTNVHVVLHTLNLAVLPEVRLSGRYSAVLRFGLAAGVRVAGSMSGRRYSSAPNSGTTETFFPMPSLMFLAGSCVPSSGSVSMCQWVLEAVSRSTPMWREDQCC